MRRLAMALAATLALAAPAAATGPFNMFVDDRFQRPATTSPTVTGPASDTPAGTDPYSAPSTGAAYTVTGSVSAFIDSSHLLHCSPQTNFTTDGVVSPANESLLNQATRITLGTGLTGLNGCVRLRVGNGGLNSYQAVYTNATVTFQSVITNGTTATATLNGGIGLTYAAGTVDAYQTAPVVLHFQADGSGPTTLTSWLADPATPGTPIAGTTFTITDSTSALQSSGLYALGINKNVDRWQRANTSAAPVVTASAGQVAGTASTCQFVAPTITVGQAPYTYLWESSPPGATFTWTTVAGATTVQPTFAVSAPTLFRLTVTDVNGLVSTPAVFLGQPWRAPLKVAFAGDSITNFGGLGRASYNTAGSPDGNAAVGNAVMTELAQQMIGPRNLSLYGMGVGGTASKDWRPDSAAWNPGSGVEATNLYSQLVAVMTAAGFTAGDVVSIELGMNDSFVDDLPSYTANMAAIVNGLKAAFPGVLVVIQRPTCSSINSTMGQNRPGVLQQFGAAGAGLANPAGGIFAAGTEAYDYFARHPELTQADGVHPLGYSTNTAPYTALNSLRFKAIRDALDGVGATSGGGYRRRPQF